MQHAGFTQRVERSALTGLSGKHVCKVSTAVTNQSGTTKYGHQLKPNQ